MKYLLVPFIALGMGTAAYAADYPPCSKTVQDQCTSAAATHHAAAKAKPAKARTHRMAHHVTKAKAAEKTAKS